MVRSGFLPSVIGLPAPMVLSTSSLELTGSHESHAHPVTGPEASERHTHRHRIIATTYAQVQGLGPEPKAVMPASSKIFEKASNEPKSLLI
jgi:hypothetical protein